MIQQNQAVRPLPATRSTSLPGKTFCEGEPERSSTSIPGGGSERSHPERQEVTTGVCQPVPGERHRCFIILFNNKSLLVIYYLQLGQMLFGAEGDSQDRRCLSRPGRAVTGELVTCGGTLS